MTTQNRPCQEPLRVTLLRTGLIAMLGGGVLAGLWGGLARWPMASLLVFWPSFGGHWVEIWYLNWLRQRVPAARGPQVAARLGVWFLGGSIIAVGMGLTAMAMEGHLPARWNLLWFGGLGFIGIELVTHLVMQLRGHPNFYNGRG